MLFPKRALRRPLPTQDVCSNDLYQFSDDQTSSSSVRVDRSLSSLLLDVSNLPPPHPGLSVVLSRQLIGAGFHRTLLTKVEQVSYHHHHIIIADHSVLRVAIVENITCDMYVDIDQVALLAGFGGPDLVASSYMDTEKPASISPNHNMIMTFTSDGGKVELPLHFRYQPPSSSHSPYKTVTIPSPVVFVPTSQLPNEPQQPSIRLPCNASSNSDELCSWTRAQLYNNKGGDGGLEELVAEIPQGLEEHQAMVVGITVLVTLVATTVIICSFVRRWYGIENEKKSR